MRAWAAAVVVLLAGCTAPPPPDAGPAPLPTGLLAAEAGPGFFLLPHAGGELAFSSTGHARIELFGPDDQRLGSLELGSLLGAEPVRIERPAGDHVLHIVSADGRLSVASGGAEARLHPLPLQVERSLLLEEPGGLGLSLPVGGGPPVAATRNVTFQRVPVGLRAVVVGTFDEVQVDAQGAGLAYRGEALGSYPLFFQGGRHELAGTFDPDGVRDGNLTAHVTASSLQGTVLLEATTYVRRLPPAGLPTVAAPPQTAFLYGFLPDGPVEFHVADGARSLVLEGGPDGAAVALFGPTDRPLGAYTVAAGARRALAVPGGGPYVAALLAGNATLGADAAPAAFDLRPLQTSVVSGPKGYAGSEGAYGAAEEPVAAGGVPYRVEAFRFGPGFAGLTSFDCPGDAAVRLRQGGETLYGWVGGNATVPDAVASGLLDGTPLSVWHDDHGDDGCGRPGVLVRSYTR